MKGPKTCDDCGRTFYKGAWMWLREIVTPTVVVSLDGTVRRDMNMRYKLTCMRCG